MSTAVTPVVALGDAGMLAAAPLFPSGTPGRWRIGLVELSH
jgi:hypothetical protein